MINKAGKLIQSIYVQPTISALRQWNADTQCNGLQRFLKDMLTETNIYKG